MSDRPPLAELLPESGDASELLFGFLEWVEEGGRSPWPHQEEALMELAAGHHVLLETPTGSGKSLVALGLHALAFGRAEKSVYTAPIKALVNEKFFSLCDDLGAEYVGLMTGDASVNRDAPVLCCTAEVLAQIALTEGDKAGIRHVVMDEFHYYGDAGRGMAWHLPLIALEKTRFLLMSATLGDTAFVREALAARTGREVKRVHMTQRPIPLTWEYSETPMHETVGRLQRAGRMPAYLVHPSRREAAEQAQALMSQDFLSKDDKKALKERLKGERFPSPFGATLKRHLLHGVGIHHAGLLPRYRLLVERLAQEGRLSVISGTDTLGVGVNVPIRSVVMTSLSRFNGTTVTWPSVRDFHQVAGRAGRAGFDTEGLVVIQAPPWAIENQERARKAALKGKKKVRKVSPPDRVKPWNEDTFERLKSGTPEALVPRFDITPGLMLEVLRREHQTPTHQFLGYGALIDLLEESHLEPHEKRKLRTRAAEVFRGLRRAGVLQVVAGPEDGPHKVVVPDPGLPDDLSLTHALSVWLVEAVALLDETDPDHAFNVLSVVESVADDPHPILRAQLKREKGSRIADLKAQGMDYEDRMEALEKVTWPKPLKDWLWAVFEPWSEAHPWVQGRGPRPKSIVREMAERQATFAEYVGELGLGRAEGIVLRYLAQVWRLLARGLPESARTEPVVEIIGWLRGVLAHTDDSLVSAWETRMFGESASAVEAPEEAALLADPRAWKGRLRAEMQALLRSLALGDFDEAAEGLRGSAWPGDRLKEAIRPLLMGGGVVLHDARTKLGNHLSVHKEGPADWRVEQALLDGEEERVGVVRGIARAEPGQIPSGPALEVLEIEVW